jgi:hypothetical protein
VRNRLATFDGVLAMSLAGTFVLCLYGLTMTQMHPDQLAFVPLFAPDRWPFNPGWFEKPPFYSYCNYFLTVLPSTVIAGVLRLDAHALQVLQVAWARVVMAGMLLAAAGVVFTMTRKAFGVFSARIITIIFVTSAGMIAFVHQLTADVPVTLWMLVAFHFSAAILRDDRPSNYVLAGLFTGIATATKYNGLAVGAAIVVAHLLSYVSTRAPRWWRDVVVSRKLVVGLAMVPVGFVVGNPYAVLDHHRFKADFLYNYIVAPVYEGQTGHSWGSFFLRIVETIGLPAFAVFTVAVVVSTSVVLRSKRLRVPEATFWTLLVVCALYYAKFAPFPRLETRFVLPIVPFWLMLSAPCWERLRRHATPLAAVMATLVAYNVVCALYVGSRFRADPRAAAEAWVHANVVAGSTIEADVYSAGGYAQPPLRATPMPFVTGRERLFARVFPGDVFINGSDVAQHEAEERTRWYSIAELTHRDPDYVIVNSLYYDRFLEPGRRRDLYPSMREFFDVLLAGRSPYRIVFDRRSPPVPAVIYPREIDFLANRATILAKPQNGETIADGLEATSRLDTTRR